MPVTKACLPTRQGSILVYCIIILAMMLVIASGMSFVTITDQKTATTTEASTQAIQTADSGMNLGIKAINSNLTNSLSTAFQNVGSGCISGSAPIISGTAGGGTYQLTFKDSSGAAITDCSVKSNTVANIQSDGIYKNTVRSVSTGLTVPCPSTLTDASGNTYNTVTIGGLCWMASNLETTKKPDGTNLTLASDYYCPPNTSDTGSDCPAVTNAATNKIGYLYTWNAAMNGSAAATAAGAQIQGICPNGWHIPSDYNGVATEDWQKLFSSTSESDNAVALNDTVNYWTSTPTSLAFTNSSGFGAVGAGFYTGSYKNRDTDGYFWASSQASSANAVEHFIDDAGDGYHLSTSENMFKTYAISVRCVKNY